MGAKTQAFTNYEDLVIFVEADFFTISNKGIPKYLVFCIEVNVQTNVKNNILLYTLEVDPFFEMLYEKNDNVFQDLFDSYAKNNERIGELPPEEQVRRYVAIVIIR